MIPPRAARLSSLGGGDQGLGAVVTRSSAPYVTIRLLAERGFWTLTPGAQMTLFEFDDLSGRLEVVPSAYGSPGVFDALTMNALISEWASGSRDGSNVEVSATELAEMLGLSMYGGLSARLARAVETLKFTGYRYVEQDSAGGATDAFSVLDRVQTRWQGAPSSPKRRIRATFSAVVLETISNRRMIRPVDVATVHALGEQRDLARRLFFFLESSPGHRSGGHDVIDRIVDERLAGTLGATSDLRELRRQLIRAVAAIATASEGRYRVELAPRTKRGLRRGDPRYLLSARRERV